MKPNNTYGFYRFAAMLIACLLLSSGAAEARKYHRHREDNGQAFNETGQFDYYLLALSWSPEFCNSPSGRQPSKHAQCTSKLGFVIHGLWPQFYGQAYPQDCGPEADVPAAVAAIALNAVPPMPPGDEQLFKHEWSKHGTCSGLNMTEYFTAIKTSAEKVAIPEPLKAPRTDIALDAGAIAGAFAAANPGLKADMMNIEVDRRGNVSSVQICFSKQLSFQTCSGRHSLKGGTFLPVN